MLAFSPFTINITPFKFDYTLKSTDGTEINYVNFVRPNEYVTLKGDGFVEGDAALHARHIAESEARRQPAVYPALMVDAAGAGVLMPKLSDRHRYLAVFK